MEVHGRLLPQVPPPHRVDLAAEDHLTMRVLRAQQALLGRGLQAVMVILPFQQMAVAVAAGVLRRLVPQEPPLLRVTAGPEFPPA
jgi:hypothetical protein